MAFRVVVTPEAQAAIDRDVAYVRDHASARVAERWYRGLIAAIASLSDMPTRCGVIPEQPLFEVELRQLLYGGRQHKRRIIFWIDDDCVCVVSIQHGSLPPLRGVEEW